MARARRPTRGWFFRTKQPHHYTWLIALVLAILGIAGTHAHIDFVSPQRLLVRGRRLRRLGARHGHRRPVSGRIGKIVLTGGWR